MAKKRYSSGDEGVMSETGNWNVASEYSKLKIMKHLYESDEFQTIATFGTSSFIEELQMNVNPDYLKIKAFRRLVNALIMLIDNSLFAIKQPGEVKTLEKYRKQLVRIFEIIPSLFKTSRNQITKTSQLKIDKEKYDPILKMVIDIKREINKPLNKSDLLFLDKEEFDPREFKKQIMDSITSRG